MIEEFPYTIQVPKSRGDRHWEQTQWCEQQLGKRWCAIEHRSGVWRCFWGGRSIPGIYKWDFKNEKDALLFSLRWL